MSSGHQWFKVAWCSLCSTTRGAATLLSGSPGSPAYNVVLALVSHVFSADIRRGAGSSRIWMVAGVIYGAALGLAHLMVTNRVDMSGITSHHRDAVMSIFASLTKRSICEIGSCCNDVLEYADALENAGMQRLVATFAGLKCGNLCIRGDSAQTQKKSQEWRWSTHEFGVLWPSRWSLCAIGSINSS